MWLTSEWSVIVGAGVLITQPNANYDLYYISFYSTIGSLSAERLVFPNFFAFLPTFMCIFFTFFSRLHTENTDYYHSNHLQNWRNSSASFNIHVFLSSAASRTDAFGKVETLKVNTKTCGNAIELTILRWHQVQTPHRATSQTAHTTDATDTSNTLRDTEPGGERRRGHGAETHRGQR